MKFLSAIILLSILLSGCVTPMGMTSSTTPVQGREMENLGRAEGSDKTMSVFGIWSVGRPDIDKAIKMAVDSKGGDALINVSWYDRTYYFIVFSINEVIVCGDVVKFTNEKSVKKPGKK